VNSIAPIDLSVIIVNYNGKKDLPRCLAALSAERSGLSFEVLVVDNGSQDGSPEDVEQNFSWAHVIRTGKNLGYAAACNRGLAEAHGRHILLLNPDTEVLSGSLAALISALDSNPEWGIVGPKMLDEQSIPYRAARRFPKPYYLFCECTRLVYFFPRSSLFSSYFYGNCGIDLLDRVDQVEGSALMISATARVAVGPMDERFFLFFEEVDWCKRVQNAGFEIHIVQDAVVRHFRATTMSRFYIEARKANAESAVKYFHKHHGNKGVKSLKRWMTVALWIRQIGATVAGWLSRSELAKLRAEGARVERQTYRRFSPL